jgi:hypothetical protein
MRKIALIVLSVASFIFSQDEADLYYGKQENNHKFFLKTGAGIGASYGGWFGAGVEAGYSMISINGGLGVIYPNTSRGNGSIKIKGKLGWQTGLRVYFTPEENRFRPSLAINFGRVYPYATYFNDSLEEGVTTAITPCVVFDNKLKNEKIGLTYGIGPVFYTNFSEVNDKISKMTGTDFTLNFSLIFGVNFFIF